MEKRQGEPTVVPKKRPLSVTLEFKDVSYEVREKRKGLFRRHVETKQILHHVSGVVEAGDFVALMGASGAGKSTLLNILSRRIVTNDGEVLINGVSADRSPILRSSSCFIQQDDLFYGYITVREHLEQQARFRLPLPEAARQQRVQQVMDRFSLNKSRDSRIGNVAQGARRGISGGEKKRLSLATELLINPSLIFADEPTSGLDAFMAESVVEVLQFLAASGHTVITTIHQPSSDVFAMFNKVLLLSEGRVVYFGPRLGAIPYFLRLGHPCPPYTNPADFLIELLAIDWENPTEKLEQLKSWEQHWQQHGAEFIREWVSVMKDDGYVWSVQDTELKEKFEHAMIDSPTTETGLVGSTVLEERRTTRDDTPIAEEEIFQIPTRADGRPQPVPARTVISTLLKRNIIASARNPSTVRARLMQVCVTALLGGLVYFRLVESATYSKAGACFFVLVNQGFMLTFSAITAFMNEKVIVIRERDGGLYNLTTYFVAKLASDFMFQFYLPIVYIIISWFLMGLNDTAWRFFLAAAYLFTLALGVSSIGYIVASFAPHIGVAVALGPLILLPCMIISGFVIQKPSLPKFWLGLYYISPFVYGFSALMRCVFLDTHYIAADGTLADGNDVLAQFAIPTEPEYWWIDFVALLAWGILGRILAWLLFLWANQRRRR